MNSYEFLLKNVNIKYKNFRYKMCAFIILINNSLKIMSKTGHNDFYYILKFICNLYINRVPYFLTSAPYCDHTAPKSELLILSTHFLFKLQFPTMTISPLNPSNVPSYNILLLKVNQSPLLQLSYNLNIISQYGHVSLKSELQLQNGIQLPRLH